MNDMHMGEVETQFAKIIWDNAPMSSGTLVKKAAETFSWKKSTTYTVLKKLCEKGLFENQNGTVTVCIGEKEYQAIRSEQTVMNEYEGSLPAFIAAFTSRNVLSEKEILAIRRIIDSGGKEDT